MCCSKGAIDVVGCGQLSACVWPSTTSSCPVTLPARSLAANSTMLAISRVVTMRPSAA